jgi:hypothetical protein
MDRIVANRDLSPNWTSIDSSSELCHEMQHVTSNLQRGITFYAPLKPFLGMTVIDTSEGYGGGVRKN